jgi:predicted PurR-regulated permease PerM
MATAGAVLTLIAFGGVRRTSVILAMLLAAAFFAIGLDRVVVRLVRRGLRRGVAIAVLALSGLVVACAIAAVGVPALAQQVESFFHDLPQRIDAALQHGGLVSLASSTDIEQQLHEQITPKNVAALATGLLTGVVSLVGVVVLGFTTAMLTLFVLAGLDRLRAGGLRLVVASRRDRVSRLAAAVQDKVGGYLVGAVTIAAFAGVAAALWTVLTGVPYPLLMALLVAGFDLIPQIGATIGSVIVISVALSESLGLAIATLVFFSCYQAIENWVIYPRLMGHAVKITNLAAIVSAMIGWALLGVLGVLIAVPAYASIQLLVREVVFPRQDAR